LTTIKEYTKRAEAVILEALEAAGFKAEVSRFLGVGLNSDNAGGYAETTVHLYLDDLFVQPKLIGKSVEDA